MKKFMFGNMREPQNTLLETDEQEEITFHSDSFWWINSTLKTVLRAWLQTYSAPKSKKMSATSQTCQTVIQVNMSAGTPVKGKGK